jgi:saccharopine dehydrogenase (NADP+, L-glutamate forming)
VSLAIESVLNNEIEPGVSAAPDKPEQIDKWLSALTAHSESIGHHDHVAK